jgi:hypothetical protein
MHREAKHSVFKVGKEQWAALKRERRASEESLLTTKTPSANPEL